MPAYAAPIKKQDCAHCSLATICLPDGLSREEMARLDLIIKRRRPKQRGEFVYRHGDPFRAVYAVRTGSVKTYTTVPDGRTMVTGFYLAGELLGLEGIHTKHHVGNAKVLETTSICEIPFAHLSTLGQQIPHLQSQVFRVLSREIGYEQQVMLLLGKKSSDERLAAFLLRLAERYHHRGYAAQEFNLSMSRSDIANYLGLAIETVSRVFTRFNRQKLVTINRKLVTIHDDAGLKALANDLVLPRPKCG